MMRWTEVMQQDRVRRVDEAAEENTRRRVERAMQAQQGQRRPTSKARKGSSASVGLKKGDAAAGYGTKNGQQKASGWREKEGRRYERGGAADHGRDAWRRDSVLERTCGPPEGAFGNGAARGDGSESVDEDEGKVLAAELAKLRKLTESLEARMRQKKQGAAKRADTKARGRMDDDGDSEQGAIGGRGDGTDGALTGEGAGVTFGEEGEEHDG